MKRPIIITFMIAASFLMVTITEAQIYKWKDAKGQIHYASTPPRPNEKSSELKKDLSFLSSSPSTSEGNVAKKKDKSQNIDSEETQKTLNKKLDFCSKEKNNLKLLQQNTAVTWLENGKKIPLSGKMIEDKIQVIKESIKTHCPTKGSEINN